MSHITGVVVTQTPASGVGPDHGNMGVNFSYAPAPALSDPPNPPNPIPLARTNSDAS